VEKLSDWAYMWREVQMELLQKLTCLSRKTTQCELLIDQGGYLFCHFFKNIRNEWAYGRINIDQAARANNTPRTQNAKMQLHCPELYSLSSLAFPFLVQERIIASVCLPFSSVDFPFCFLFCVDRTVQMVHIFASSFTRSSYVNIGTRRNRFSLIFSLYTFSM